MSKIENFEVGQEYYQARVYANGTPVDCQCDCFTSLTEAIEDGEYQAASYDPEWQKNNPDCVESRVKKYRVTKVDADDASQFSAESVAE